jgi:hypothetical protein
VLEEADETVLWLECLSETGIIRTELVQDLLKEANELVAICRIIPDRPALRFEIT